MPYSSSAAVHIPSSCALLLCCGAAVLCRYRKLFVLFSSYTYVNRLQRMVVR